MKRSRYGVATMPTRSTPEAPECASCEIVTARPKRGRVRKIQVHLSFIRNLMLSHVNYYEPFDRTQVAEALSDALRIRPSLDLYRGVDLGLKKMARYGLVHRFRPSGQVGIYQLTPSPAVAPGSGL